MTAIADKGGSAFAGIKPMPCENLLSPVTGLADVPQRPMHVSAAHR